jgi:hypothetical protein
MLSRMLEKWPEMRDIVKSFYTERFTPSFVLILIICSCIISVIKNHVKIEWFDFKKVNLRYYRPHLFGKKLRLGFL